MKRDRHVHHKGKDKSLKVKADLAEVIVHPVAGKSGAVAAITGTKRTHIEIHPVKGYITQVRRMENGSIWLEVGKAAGVTVL